MKKMFVLFMVLVVVMIIGVGCRNNAPKKGENFQIVEDQEPLEVYRGVTTGIVSISGDWAKIQVVNPPDNMWEQFQLDVLCRYNGPAIYEIKKVKAGEELLFHMDRVTSVDPYPTAGSMHTAQIGYFRGWSSSIIYSEDLTILNPPIKK